MKKKAFLLVLALSLVLTATIAMASVEEIKMYVNGKEIKSDVSPVMQENRVLVPVRFVAEALGCDVQWDEAKNAVIITRNSGDKFLRGKNDPAQQKPSIHTNFIKAADLMAALDDDKDGDLCDYRDGHSGGDSIANDPLVVDVRGKKDYDAGHIPGAIWISTAEEIAAPANLAALKDTLDAHVAKGGKSEVVLYCFTGHTAGLAAGVLGSEGINVKDLRFGYAVAWEGTKQADAPVLGPREDVNGKPVPYAPAVK